MLWSSTTAGVFLQEGIGREAGQGIGKCPGVRHCVEAHRSDFLVYGPELYIRIQLFYICTGLKSIVDQIHQSLHLSSIRWF